MKTDPNLGIDLADSYHFFFKTLNRNSFPITQKVYDQLAMFLYYFDKIVAIHQTYLIKIQVR
jgi:hypothetical protein